MQVVTPIDAADALRADLAAMVDGPRFFCLPIPPDLKAGDVVVEQLGGTRVGGSSNAYDLSISAYAADDAAAADMANMLCGVVASLPLRDTSTQYGNASANLPYADHDPRAPQLARQTFRATVICPGTRTEI